MPKGFERLTIKPETLAAEVPESFAKGVPPLASPGTPRRSPRLESDEAAARYYLEKSTAQTEGPAFRSLAADPGEPTLSSTPMPNLALVKEPKKSALTKTTLVQFEQTKSKVPIFGSRAVVELDQERNFVSGSVHVADVGDVSAEPHVTAEQARATLSQVVGRGMGDPEIMAAPRKTFLCHPTQGTWHLAWHFHDVPFPPQAEQSERPPFEPEAMERFPLPSTFDYFVDAHTGELVYYFSNRAHLEIPTWCRGQDEDGQTRTFFGRRNGAAFEMHNPFEEVRTFDLRLQEIERVDPPSTPIQSPSADWQDSNPAAVTAQVNATRVLDFLFRVLRRNSIDDQGMPLLNVVNCSSQDAKNHPEWKNATWHRGRMWYGQESLGGGRYRSLARHLDILAHELTHGITEHTANLVYRDLSGALNESMSDIFGVIINNWHSPNAADPDRWSWEIGAGLGPGGAALRNIRDPGSVGRWFKPNDEGGWTQVDGYPGHMRDYVPLPASYDDGGVHIYSNIHNRAAYQVLTSKGRNGSYVFTPEEVAVLYYLTLTRLTGLSDFSDARSECLDVVAAIYAGDSDRREECGQAVRNAYDRVGIT